MKKRNNAKKQIKQKEPEKVAQAEEVTAAAEPETVESRPEEKEATPQAGKAETAEPETAESRPEKPSHSGRKAREASPSAHRIWAATMHRR